MPKIKPPSLFKPDVVNPGTEDAFVPPTVTPFGQDEINPFKTGLQLGAVGAAAGVGIASIQRALRLRAGDTTPVSVYKPMVLGAVIGAALGSVGGYKSHQYIDTHQPYPQPQSWDELAGRLEDGAELNKYGGLMHIVKHAQATGGDIAMEAAKIPLSFVPVVGTAMAVGDAAGNIGRGWRNVFKGNWRGAAGEGMGFAGNAALALASLFTGGSNILGGTAKSIKGIANIGRLGQAGLTGAAARRATAMAGGRLGGLRKWLSPVAQRVEQMPGVMQKLEAGGKAIAPYKRYRNKLGLGSLGLAIGGGVLTAPPSGVKLPPGAPFVGHHPGNVPGSPRYNPAMAGLRRSANIPDQEMPEMEVPYAPY